MEDSYNDMAATNADKENDNVLLGGKRDETDAKVTDGGVKTTVVSDNWKIKENKNAPLSERGSSGQDKKDTKHAVLTPKEKVTVKRKIDVRVLLGGERDETDAKLAEDDVKTTDVSDNWKLKEKEKAPLSERERFGQDEKCTEYAVLTPKETVTVNKKIEVKESEVGKDHTHVSI